MARLKVEPGTFSTAATNSNANAQISLGQLNFGNAGGIQQSAGTMVAASAAPPQQTTLQGTQLLGTIDCYEDVFKEITKKLYGDETGVAITGDLLDTSSVISSMTASQPLVYDTADLFRQQDLTSAAGTATLTSNGAGGLAIVTAPGANGLPAGTFLVQRRLQDDKGRIWTIEGLPQAGEQIAFATVAPAANNTIATIQQQQQPQQSPSTTTTTLQASLQQQHQQQQQPPSVFEEKWFESDEQLTWTQSRIARYNPTQKVFRCVDCDFVGFLSRVAEHWLGNHADLRVFQCPRCPYTSAWARCVRMHLTRQHGETLTDNSLWKENPVLEEVTKFLNTLKTKVEQKNEPVNTNGEKRYTCPYCPYQTDRRDLYNRHENIHRDEKPFQCYVCDKQFNRADHVKKHFMRMHREHTYDINKIRKANVAKQGSVQFFNGSKVAVNKPQQQLRQGGQIEQNQQQQQQVHIQLQQQTQEQQQQLLLQQNQFEQVQIKQENDDVTSGLTLGNTQDSLAVQLQHAGGNQNQTVTVQQIPHIAYFNPPSAPGQSGPLQGIPGVGGTKKEAKPKGHKKKKSGEKMYTCSYCPWQGVDNWCLKRHLNTHIKPFLCALCDYKAARSERLATHVLKVHNKRVCHKCSFLADDSESLSQHIQDSHQNPLVKTGFHCNVCQEYFELRADLEAHAILEHQKVIVQCDLCDFRTTDELSMEAHLRDKHNLTPGMGAVAAAAAAAAAAAIGQPINSQYQLQVQSQSQVHLPEHLDTSDQLLNQPGVISTNVASVSSSNQGSFPGSSTSFTRGNRNVAVAEVEVEPEEPETLCEKCGIDFVDEQSRKLHEKRHELVNPAEDESVKGVKASTTKRFFRTYVCSTCSYTCATKKMMMQHQRAHTGFELVCQAENCMFSTPFDNTLKEHIQNDHGSEEHVRCPHCGICIPSNSAFTSHWRFHHLTICSLCVNVYRIRYDVKENDISDVICKVPATMYNSHHETDSLLFKLDSGGSGTADIASGLPLSDQRLVEDLAGLVMPDGLDEPLLKKPRFGLGPISSAASTLSKRESIRFLPRLVEVTVAPMPPRTKRAKGYRRRRRRRRLGSERLFFGNIGATPTTPQMMKSGSGKSSLSKRISKFLRLIQKIEASRRTGLIRVSRRRRFCQKGTFSWLFRNPREGYKCYSPLCENKCSWRYPRKIGLILHNIWYHRLPRFKCDICGLQFPHLYQAFLHKIVQHADLLCQAAQLQQQILQNSLLC